MHQHYVQKGVKKKKKKRIRSFYTSVDYSRSVFLARGSLTLLVDLEVASHE